MKRLTKLIFLLICSFGFILTADAFSVGESFPFASHDYGNQGDLWGHDGSNYHVNMYYAVGEHSQEYGVLCLDPHKGTPAELNVFRVLMDSEKYYAEDYGILKLLSAYGGNTLQDDNTLYAQGLAVRLLADGVYGWTNTSKINIDKVKDLQGAARAIVASGTCKTHNYSTSSFIYTNSAYKSTNFAELGFQYSGSDSDFNGYGLKINSIYRQKILEYFCAGYDAYMSYKAGDEDAKLPIANGSNSFTKVSEDEKSSYFVVALQVKDLGDNLEANINNGSISLTYDGLDYVHKDYSFNVIGLSTKLSNDNFEENYNIPITEGQNLLQIPEVKEAIINGEGKATFYVAVYYDFFGDENSEKGVAHFEYTFNHPKSLHGALLKADAGGFDISAFQRFISFGYDGQNKYVELNPDIIGCPPALIPQICKDGMKETEQYHAEDGTVTFTFIESALPDSTENRIDKCILEHQDVFANPYRLIDNENAALISGNPYCQMYCKEDFVFNLPYERETQNGRYFQIRTSISGKQLCYSTKIDENGFKDDLNAAQKTLIDYYNEYHYYDLLLTTTPVDSSDDKSFKVKENICQKNQSSCCSTSISCCDPPDEGEPEPTSACCCWTHETGTATEPTEKILRYKVINLADTFYVYEENTDLHTLTVKGGASFKDTFIYKNYGGSGSGGSGGGATRTAFTANDSYTLYQLGLERAIENNYSVVQLGGVIKKPVIKTASISLDNEGYDADDDGMYLGGDKHGGKQCYAYYETSTCNDGECTLRTIGECSVEVSTTYYEFEDPMEDFDSKKAEWENARSAAKAKMEGAQATILQLIDLYNACTGSDKIESVSGAYGSFEWKIAYNFNPKISYEYYEPDVDEYKLNAEPYKWIKEVQNTQCGNTTCDVMVTSGIELHSEVFKANGSENTTYDWKNSATEPMYDLNYKDAEEWDTSKTLNAKTYCFDDKVDPNTRECANPKTSYNGEHKIIDVYQFDGTDFVKKEYKVSTVTYINTASTARASYDTQRVYYSGTPQGQIKISNKKPEGEYAQVDGLPVSIRTADGVHYYKIKLNNIGTYYSTGNLGRVYGDNINSLSNYNGTKPLAEGNGKKENEQLEVEQNEYACSYTIGTPPGGGKSCIETAEHGYCVCDTPTWDESCDCKGTSAEARADALRGAGCTVDGNGDVIGPDAGGKCNANVSCCPYCTITCIGPCIYEGKDWPEEGGDSLLNFRAVNDSDVNPNERELGYNWDSQNYGNDVNWGQSTPNILIAQKAGITIDEIESRANVNIATVTDPEQLDDVNSPEMVVKLTPSMISYVKDYNKTQESKGSYNNDTLDCYDYVVEYTDKQVCLDNGFIWEPNDDVPDPYNPYNEQGACVMKSIFCYSSFIDDLQDNFNTSADKQQVIIKGNRRKGNIKYDASIPKFAMAGEISKPYLNGNKYSLSGGYDVEVQNIDNYWAVFYYNKLDVNGDHVADIGPSWK